MTVTERVNLVPGCDELEWFTTCFNLAYPDWEIYGNADRELTTDEIDIIQLRSYWGRCGVSRTGNIRIGLNRREMSNNPPGWSIGLISHELGHVKHHDHSPAFWELAIDIADRLHEHQHEIESVIGESIDWTDVEDFLIQDPLMNCVDGRSETPYGRRKKIAEHFGRPDAVEPFDGVNWSYMFHADGTKLSANQIIDPIPPVEEVAEWLEPHRRNAGVKMRNNNLVLDRPTLEPVDGKYTFTDEMSMYRYAFMYYDRGATDSAYHPVVVKK